MSFFKKLTKKKEKKTAKAEPEEDAGAAADGGDFNVEDDCAKLKKAMKGLGTDEDDLISVLCCRTSDQRRQIVEKFRDAYSKELLKEIEDETSGDFKLVLTRMCRDQYELAAFELNEAIKEDPIDRQCIVEILCTRSNEDVAEIRQKYLDKYGESLEQDLGKSGELKNEEFRRLLSCVLSVSRNVEHIDESLAKDTAEKLETPGEEGENRFDSVLSARSYPQVQATFAAYAKKNNKDIDNEFHEEFTSAIANDLLAAMFAIRNKEAYLAGRLYQSMKGAGTKDTLLIRLITSRFDIDLEDVKKEYLRLYGRSLAKDVSSDTSGDYKKALLTLLGEN